MRWNTWLQSFPCLQFFLPVCNASWMMWEGPRFLSTFRAPWRYCNQLGQSGTSPRGECQLAGMTVLLALLSGLKSSHSSTQTTQFRQLQNRKQSGKCVPEEEELQEGGQAGAQGGERTLPRVFQLLNCALPHIHSVSLVKSLGKHLWKQAYYDKSFIWLSRKGSSSMSLHQWQALLQPLLRKTLMPAKSSGPSSKASAEALPRKTLPCIPCMT